MKEVLSGVHISQELHAFLLEICDERELELSSVIKSLAEITRKFSKKNNEQLDTRDELQKQIDLFFKDSGSVTTVDVVNKLKEIKYIAQETESNEKVTTKNIDSEIHPMAGPQLVVPADKANMVLNAANARWSSLYNSLYSSNIIDESINSQEDRKKAVIEYTNNFLDKITKFKGGLSWNDIVNFSFDIKTKQFSAYSANDKKTSLVDETKLVGLTLNDEKLSSFILENNSLKIEFILNNSGGIKDIQLESAITYIIDLEDASISAPENKYEAYRILKGITDGSLECEVRGELRKIKADTIYFDPITLQERVLKRSSLALVRDVGPHMVADSDIITVDGEAISEKILDMFITSFIGLRYHVAPKMHGAKEVALNVEVWNEINKAQKLTDNANKIGIMNEELRTNAQLKDCVLAAKDIVFFTNTGFLDYTGSFIDLMMYQGAIAPYRELPSKLYKSSYELHNVNVSLDLNVPQIGAGMWAAIKDMKGLLESKESQVKGLTDTGWSPSPSAAAIHAMAFHIFGDVRTMQDKYRKNIKNIKTEDLFEFPKADLENLNDEEIIENIDFAIHGLLAYAEPWVRRGIGCSGVKELSGAPLMEDRATARIKAAFIRNWLLHQVVSKEQVEDSIKRMAMLVDKQNSDEVGYKNIHDNAVENGDWENAEETIKAVHDVLFNPKKLKHSYVEPYFYPANRREAKKTCKK